MCCDGVGRSAYVYNLYGVFFFFGAALGDQLGQGRDVASEL